MLKPFTMVTQIRLKSSGFSLMELLVVVALAAILSTLAAPSVGELITNQHIRGTAESIVSGLQISREEALRRNRPVSFWLVSDLSSNCALSSSSASWVVSINTPAGACNIAPSATVNPMVVGSQLAHTSIKAVAVNRNNDFASEVRFDGSGRIYMTGLPIAQIDLRALSDVGNADFSTHKYRSLRIVIQGSGAVRICDPRVSGNGDTRKC